MAKKTRKRDAQAAWNRAHQPADPAIFTTQQRKMQTGTPISSEQFGG